MKAFLLAAGTGSRLKPLTDSVPKCLIPIAGRPLLDWWMDLFQMHKVAEVLINTSYLFEQVRAYIEEYNARGTGIRIQEFYEERLLGSGGTVLVNRDFVSNEEDFFICYADNLTKINLTALKEFHRTHNGYLTMALSPSNTPEQAGIVALDENNRIVEFEEKPAEPKSDLANAGVYVADNNIFKFFQCQEVIDFGRDVFPQLLGHMYGYRIFEYHLDVGIHQNLKKAREEWPLIMKISNEEEMKRKY